MTDNTISKLTYIEVKQLETLLWSFVDDYGETFTIQELYDKVLDVKESMEAQKEKKEEHSPLCRVMSNLYPETWEKRRKRTHE